MANPYIIQYNLQDELLVPPQLRKVKHIAYLNSISGPLQWMHDITWVASYADGFGYAAYLTSSTYLPGDGKIPGDRVIYIDRGVYECIATASNVAPMKVGSTNWILIADNYIGARERVAYNSQKVLFEYALNRWFQTGVLTIPYSGGIYISNNPSKANSFIMGLATQNLSSYMTNTTLTQPQSGYLSHQPYNPPPNPNNFTINVPISVANIIDPGNTYSVPTPSPNTNSIIRAFADTLKLSGMLYDIKTY